MLIDEAPIYVEAGRGGDGTVSFRHEKYAPKGGPDGGDGGNGGNIIFKCLEKTHTLFDYLRLKKFKAENGNPGGKNRRHGKKGQDLTLYVPPGTVIYDTDKKWRLADLKKEADEFLVARGGKGGLGNVHFANATRQAPRIFKPGAPGDKKHLKLVLKLIAEVGIIGLTNSGKSTLLSVISAAKPKIADYPFTTLEPVLGVVNYKDKRFVCCDIPGLIEGAAEGKGLGHRFLRHIERTNILVHLIDAQSDNLEKDYQTIRDELEKFSPRLAHKKEIIVLSKIDLIRALPKNFKYDLAISAATGKGITKLLQTIASLL